MPYIMQIRHGTALSKTCLMMIFSLGFFIYPDHLLGTPAELFFSAPYSGEKVTGYEVTLPVTRNETMQFHIPDDCQTLLEAFSNGADRWGSRVERSILRKTQLDCDYVRFLGSFPRPPLHDFVRGYDFMNADLKDIPLWSSCADLTSKERYTDACREITPQSNFDISHFFSWGQEDHAQPDEKPVACRINNGTFRGRVIHDQTGIHCIQDRNKPGFRIIAIDYADVNGDDFLDAILRLIPLGRGVSRIPLVLPLTRKEPDGPFIVPDNLPGPLPTR